VVQALSSEDTGVRLGFPIVGRICKERHKLKPLRKHYLKQCRRTFNALLNLSYQTGISHSLKSYLSKVNRRQRLTSRVGGAGNFGNENSRGPELGS